MTERITIESTDTQFLCDLIDFLNAYSTVLPKSTVIKITSAGLSKKSNARILALCEAEELEEEELQAAAEVYDKHYSDICNQD